MNNQPNQISNNNHSVSQSYDNIISHNDTSTQLIKNKVINHPQITNHIHQSDHKIQSKKQIQQLPKSNQFLVDPKPIQTRHVLIRSMSQQNNLNHHSNHSLITSLKNQNHHQISNPNQSKNFFTNSQVFMRPKTMIQIQKKYQMTSQTIKHKLPLAILDLIMKNAKLNKSQIKKSTTNTATGRKIADLGLSKKLSQKYHTKKCPICEVQLPQKQFQTMTKNCPHSYCSSCLHQYVIYKINSFQAVQCPNQQCHQPFDQQSNLYAQLPLQVRKKYKKLLQYEMIKKNPNRKLCPQQKCQGWIQITPQIDAVCSMCKKQYCPKCLLASHQGDCDNQQLQFFQGTLHYRQCNKCKNIIQKSQGCIHMTCRCGYQFCYLCGAKWNHSHTCKNPEGEPIIRQRVQCCCCQVQVCDCDCDCDDCCDRCCDGCQRCWQCFTCQNCCECCQCCECYPENNCIYIVMRIILIGLIKLGIIIGYIIFIIPLLLVYLAVIGGFWFTISLISGMTAETIHIICDLEGCWFYLSLIFFPIPMFMGIIVSLKQICGEGFCEGFMQMLRGSFDSLLDIIC